MTSLPSSSRPTRTQSLLPLLLLMSALPLSLLAGCADKHIGRPCVTGLDADPTHYNVNTQALECPSRLCVLPAKNVTTATAGAMCTDFCSNDDDCSESEKYDPKTNPMGCRNGFACRMPVGGVESFALNCKRFCVCKDFLMTNEPDTKPAACH